MKVIAIVVFFLGTIYTPLLILHNSRVNDGINNIRKLKITFFNGKF